MRPESDRAVVGVKSGPPRTLMPPPLRPPFVGRDDEIRQAMTLLEAALRGEPQLALIEGPAGIGKTRLAKEIAARARRRGALAAMGRCWQGEEAPPLWPWRGILRELGAPETVLVERPGQEPSEFARFVAVADRLRGTGGAPLVIVVDGAERADVATLL